MIFGVDKKNMGTNFKTFLQANTPIKFAINKTSMKKQVLIIFFVLCSIRHYSQSASVFDASYFDMGNTKPSIEIGKGINITDVYKPTKFCFIATPKLKATQNSQQTSINYYYTKNEAQYNTLKSQGTSGQVSYLNMFSIGGSSNSSNSTKSSVMVERIVILAKVDFGIYTLVGEPLLKPEAKALITNSKFNDFIDLYGTHYISGVRKESSIWITLTKKSNLNVNKTTYGTSFNEEFCPPTYPSFKIETSDNTEIEKAINSENYDVNVEIKGPAIKPDGLQNSIGELMSGQTEDKMKALSDIINSAFKDISNQATAQYTQYYYTPFTLYNVKVIEWNDKKLNKLITINKNALTLNTSKSNLEKLTNPDGINFVSNKFDKDIPGFEKKDEYKEQYIQQFNAILPTISAYKEEVDTTLKFLEKIYTKCSNIYCNLDSVCGVTGSYEDKVTTLNSKIKAELRKMSKIKHDAWLASLPDCEKESIGYVTVVNVSSNPYDFYNGDNYIERIPSKSNLKFKFKPGKYSLKAVQVSGYMLYATVNQRPLTITQTCTEETIKIGFED